MFALSLAVLTVALLAAAWSAGFFWTWSFTVMPGLSTAAPDTAIAAMRAVNANIRGAGFGFVFFGPAPLALLAGGLALGAGARDAAIVGFVAAAIYVAGLLAVTFVVHLPMNAALAVAPVPTGGAAAVWQDYAGRWTAWNHVRTASASAAFLALLGAFALALRR